MIHLKRVYEQESPDEGNRFLVERLWPRGIRKSDLPLDGWLKDAGPSTGLRKWFAHDPAKWREFRRKYFEELEGNPNAWAPVLAAARKGAVTLLYSSHDEQHNNAVALRDFLEQKLRKNQGRNQKPAA